MGTTFEEKTEVRPPQTGLLSQTGLLTGDVHSTFVLNKNRSLRAMLGKETKPIDESAPGKEVQLIIRGIPEKVTLRESGSLILGRAEQPWPGQLLVRQLARQVAARLGGAGQVLGDPGLA